MNETRGLLSKAVVLGAVVVLVASIVMSAAGVAIATKPAPPPAPRFVDNGDGTVTDNQTGLMWEKKTDGGSGPRDVNNTYTWSATGSAPDGTLFTDFLPQLNCESSADGTCPFGGKYGDWRMPTVAELRNIVDRVAGCPGGAPCIDPIFGPTQVSSSANYYWTSSSDAGNPVKAWVVSFIFPGPSGATSTSKTVSNLSLYARAVRGGS